MGDVIRRGSAAENIFADIRTTLVRARAKGGDWKALAEERLASAVALADSTESSWPI